MNEILVDDREKKPYEFAGIENVTTDRLSVGDYTYRGYENVFAVERKSLDDLATSLGAERERFESEIQRAQNLKEFAVVIEAPASDVYAFSDKKSCPNYFSNIHPNSIIGTVEKWPQKYDVLDFYWCDNREAAKQETLRLLDTWFMRHS